MPNQLEVYKCTHCGNIVEVLHGGGAGLVCCGENMKLMKEGSTDGAMEKHVPVITVRGNEVHVAVGAAAHPMVEEHSIQWIYLQTKKGGQRKNLTAGEAPEAAFALVDDEPIAAYAYCNLHGLWRKEI